MTTGEKKITEYAGELSGKAPVPSGGGAVALTGMLGTALGLMVTNLTTGKKKYDAYQERLEQILPELSALRDRFLLLADADEYNFLPLSAAYRMPRDTEEEQAKRKEEMERCLLLACRVPLETMELSLKGLQIMEELLTIGTRLTLSDVGIGARLLSAALSGAFLNVMINARDMQDRKQAELLLSRGEAWLAQGEEIAHKVYEAVRRELQS